MAQDNELLTETEMWNLCKGAKLDLRETEILFRRTFFYTFLSYSTYRTLAKDLGISPNRVVQIERAARKKIADSMLGLLIHKETRKAVA